VGINNMYEDEKSMTREEKDYYKKKKLGSFVVNYNSELSISTDEWKPRWQELIDMYLPRKGNVYDTDTRGQKRVRIYDITGLLANEELASALHTNLTNPTTQFCEFSTGNSELDTNPKIAKYLQRRTEIFHSVLNNSNYQTEVHESYLDLGALGTRVMRIDEDEDEVVRFTCRPIFEYNCDENDKGIVDVLSREKEYTSRQLVNKFGKDFLKYSEEVHGEEAREYKIKTMLQDSRRKYKVIEMFLPSKYLKNRGIIKSYSRPYTMLYVLEEGHCFLKQDWFNELNHAVSRWTKASGEIHGRGPGSKGLAAVLMLNELAKFIVQANQLAIKPPVMVPDDGTYPGFKIFPGAVNYYRTGTRDEIKAFNSGSNVNVADWLVSRLSDHINKAFFIDKIRLPDINRMTREETVVRRDENLRAWAPILGRQEREDLLPTVKRVDSIIERRGMYPPPPSELEGANLEIKYSSQVARVQKATLADNADQWVSSMVQLSNMSRKPETLDSINFDAYSRYTAFTRSVPASLVNSEEDVQAINEQRQMQQQEMMQMQQNQSMAKTAKDAAQAAQAAPEDALDGEGGIPEGLV